MITDQIIREGVEPGKYKDSFGFLRTALVGVTAWTDRASANETSE